MLTVSRTPVNSEHGFQPAAQRGIILDPAQIAFEQAVIGGVEPHQRHEQADIRLDEARAEQEGTVFREAFFQYVEHREHIGESLLIGGLGGGEARAINPVVEAGIDLVVERVDFFAQGLRIEIDAFIRQGAEAGIEDAQDIGGFIVDDGFPLLVPQHRHGGAAGVMRVGLGIDFMQKSRAIERVAVGAGKIAETPQNPAIRPAPVARPDRGGQKKAGRRGRG